uniref:Ubiquinone biosynthesis protein COQ4 homolog, mitochondrial n=1 Tax=Ananas comosus var. bracteatus TaxID=296719 RepID=A0A6V7NR93_ANACO|nr:unnamed protein product [Ananas comosus var. bracteatus]
MQGARVSLKGWQQAAVAVGSALGALMDPRRADLIAALGETTGKPAFQRVLERMKNSPEGREVLLDRPRVISKNVSHAWDLPEGTFGAAYAKFMGSRNFSPDDRPLCDSWRQRNLLMWQPGPARCMISGTCYSASQQI